LLFTLPLAAERTGDMREPGSAVEQPPPVSPVRIVVLLGRDW